MKQPIKVTVTVTDIDGMRIEVTHIQDTNGRGDTTEASTKVIDRAANDARTWLRRQARLAARPSTVTLPTL